MKTQIKMTILLSLVLIASSVFAFPPGWSDDFRLTFDPHHAISPKTEMDASGNLHVVWGGHSVKYQKFSPTGIPLTAPIMIVSNFSTHIPDLALDANGNVHLVWSGFEYGNLEIAYQKLNNNGQPLTGAIRISNNRAYSNNPSIDVDQFDNVHIAWQDGRTYPGTPNHEIFYRKLTNNGIFLSSEVQMTNQQAESTHPQIVTTTIGNQVKTSLVWADNRTGTFEVFFTQFDLNVAMVEIPLTTNAFASKPVIDADTNGNLHIAWADGRNGPDPAEIYYMKLNQFGITTIIGDTRITNDLQYSEDPVIRVDAWNNVHLVWHDTSSNPLAPIPLCPEVGYAQLNSQGQIITQPYYLTQCPSKSREPTIAIGSDQTAHIFWIDDRDNPTDLELYYKRTLPPIQVSGISQVGQTMQFHISSPTNPNANYGSALALSSTPNIQLGNETIPLANDWLLQACLSDPISLGLQNSFGILDGNGNATVTLNIPSISLANPTPVYFAFASFDANGTILSVSNALPFTILP